VDWLTEVYKLHHEWLKIARAYGAGDLAEDFVQDTYLKLHKYGGPEKVLTDGRVNKGYVFFCLKTIVMQYHEDKVAQTDEIPHLEQEDPDCTYDDVQAMWDEIDLYTKKHYDLPKRILFKMWKSKYNVREIAYITDVSTPTIVKELKDIKDDLKEKFSKKYKTAF
jgi:DNA-directed RNA polymerase specialized sigma24 family protein